MDFTKWIHLRVGLLPPAASFSLPEAIYSLCLWGFSAAVPMAPLKDTWLTLAALPRAEGESVQAPLAWWLRNGGNVSSVGSFLPAHAWTMMRSGPVQLGRMCPRGALFGGQGGNLANALLLLASETQFYFSSNSPSGYKPAFFSSVLGGDLPSPDSGV